MTYEDDFIRFNNPAGQAVNYTLAALGLSWPPPRLVEIRFSDEDKRVYALANRSGIPDEQRAEMTHVARGAEYRMVASGIYLDERDIQDIRAGVDVRGAVPVATLAS